MLSDGAIARANLPSTAEAAKLAAVELHATITDQVPGRCADRADGATEERGYLFRGWFLGKRGNGLSATGKVIDDDRQSPAEGPALWQGER